MWALMRICGVGLSSRFGPADPVVHVLIDTRTKPGSGRVQDRADGYCQTGAHRAETDYLHRVTPSVVSVPRQSQSNRWTGSRDIVHFIEARRRGMLRPAGEIRLNLDAPLRDGLSTGWIINPVILGRILANKTGK